jgi:hypothetical protein
MFRFVALDFLSMALQNVWQGFYFYFYFPIKAEAL